LYTGLRRADLAPALGISIALFGLVLFSFVEYCFHRWLFHGSVQVLEQGHRKHHEEPQAHDALPFFLPPLVALLLAAGLSIALPVSAALLFTGGIAAGYAAYGLTHTIFHTVGSAAAGRAGRRASHPPLSPAQQLRRDDAAAGHPLRTRYLSGEKGWHRDAGSKADAGGDPPRASRRPPADRRRRRRHAGRADRARPPMRCSRPCISIQGYLVFLH
jgi:hypothetical protein